MAIMKERDPVHGVQRARVFGRRMGEADADTQAGHADVDACDDEAVNDQAPG